MTWYKNPDPAMFPRPHEGVTGIDRSDDPLMSLDPDAFSAREAVRIVALHLRNATMVGNPAPVVQRMYERMKDPRPGDLVTEESTAYFASDDDRLSDRRGHSWPFSRMGYLVAVREEWADTDEEHEKYLASERQFDLNYSERVTDTVTYLQYGPDPKDITRWYDCSFFMIPTKSRQFDDPYRSSNVVTRDSLVGSLADSGFTIRQSQTS